MKNAVSLLVALMLVSGGVFAQESAAKKSDAKVAAETAAKKSDVKVATETAKEKSSGKACCEEGCSKEMKEMKKHQHAKGEKCGACVEKEKQVKTGDTKTAPESK